MSPPKGRSRKHAHQSNRSGTREAGRREHRITADQRNLLSYWLDSIIDGQRAEIGRSDLRTSAVRVADRELLRGRIPPESYRELLKRAASDDKRGAPMQNGDDVPVLLCPLRYRRREDGGRGPAFLEVLWIPGILSSDGHLQPPKRGKPWIPRGLLEPIIGDDLPTVGTVEDLESYAARISMQSPSSWKEYIAEVERLSDAVLGSPLNRVEIDGYHRLGEGILARDDTAGSGNASLTKVLEEILAGKRPPGVLSSLATLKEPRHQQFDRRFRSLIRGTKRHCGHFSAEFALAPSQRWAVQHFLELATGDFLAVTGPPGTGKTTLLQSVIASLWVDAVRSGRAEPPVIVGCGATNQSVTNVIDSLRASEIIGSVESAQSLTAQEPGLSRRWLPGLSSYGTFCCSARRAEESREYQLELRSGEGISKEMEQPEYLDRAERYFRKRFEEWFGKPPKSIEWSVSVLRQQVELERRALCRSANAVFGTGVAGLFRRLISGKPAATSDEIWSRLEAEDRGRRHRMLLLASHFWEARWLCEARVIVSERWSSGARIDTFRGGAEEWRRRAMITPAFVSTLAMLPRFFAGRREDREPLIDLLIFDEAGQAAPELGAPCFGLAKRALIVGDDLQIEPLWAVPPHVDRMNAAKHRIVHFKDERPWNHLSRHGVLASNGSVMRMAIRASKRLEDNSRGILLSEQRRSVPEIVSVLNDLAYNGRLLPMRPSRTDRILPALGYIHVAGRGTKLGQSRFNRVEAEAIAAWIHEHAAVLRASYNTDDLSRVLAVITPFNAQTRLLRSLLDPAVAGLTIGTVQSLQGAERPVVIFSSVYDPTFRGTYVFDRGPNLLNVAVSRARDSFLVVGHMGIFNPKGRAPSAILGRALFAKETNEVLAPVPPRDDLPSSSSSRLLVSLDDHRAVLADAFERAKRRIIICSPGISIAALRADRIAERIREAVQRGVEVLVFTDSAIDQTPDGSGIRENAREGRALLIESGATLREVHRIHNKSLAVDSDVIVEGSFNWLSAIRSTAHEHQKLERSWYYSGDASSFVDSLLTDLEYRESMERAEPRE